MRLQGNASVSRFSASSDRVWPTSLLGSVASKWATESRGVSNDRHRQLIEKVKRKRT